MGCGTHGILLSLKQERTLLFPSSLYKPLEWYSIIAIMRPRNTKRLFHSLAKIYLCFDSFTRYCFYCLNIFLIGCQLKQEHQAYFLCVPVYPTWDSGNRGRIDRSSVHDIGLYQTLRKIMQLDVYYSFSTTLLLLPKGYFISGMLVDDQSL